MKEFVWGLLTLSTNFLRVIRIPGRDVYGRNMSLLGISTSVHTKPYWKIPLLP